MRGSKPANHVRGEKRAQRLRRQFGNCNHWVIALSLQPRVWLPMRKPKTLGHAALLRGWADADAVLPLLSHATTSPTQAFLSFFHGSENFRASCGQRACRGQHSFVGFYPSAVITAQA